MWTSPIRDLPFAALVARGTLNGLVASFLLAASLPAAVQGHQPGNAAPVRTASGLVAGVATNSGVAYKGLPYAAPPVGALRWHSPEPASPWKGVRQATSFGPPCAQAPLRGRTEVSAISREDCLYLNVWTPRLTRGAKVPVMLWIHGGGFENGMGTSPTYDGATLAAKGVIVITINYRLGVFGYLAHPELTAASPHKSSGNFGLEDQIAALRWVSANIGAFGGNPSNVTIFGQSAGGASVLDLLASPQAQGLFKRAIVESGAARSAIGVANLPSAEQQGRKFADGASIADLRRLDMAAVLQLAQDAGQRGIRFGPVLDGYVLTHEPAAALADRSHHPIALLIGNNSREGLATPTDAQLEAAIGNAFGANSIRALGFYGIAHAASGAADPLLGTAAQQFATDSTFRCGSVETAHLSAASGAPTWQYQFEQFVPGKEAQGAAHSFEVPYVFGNLSSTGFSAANYGPADRQLSELMVGYWTNFARRGDPNGPGLPAWPRYTLRDKAYLRLSSALHDGAQAASDLRGFLCRLFLSSERM